MLIPKEALTKAMTLTSSDLKQCLKANGYTDEGDIASSEFLGMNTDGDFCYTVDFTEKCADDDELNTAKVYVSINMMRNSAFTLVADY